VLPLGTSGAVPSIVIFHLPRVWGLEASCTACVSSVLASSVLLMAMSIIHPNRLWVQCEFSFFALSNSASSSLAVSSWSGWICDRCECVICLGAFAIAAARRGCSSALHILDAARNSIAVRTITIPFSGSRLDALLLLCALNTDLAVSPLQLGAASRTP